MQLLSLNPPPPQKIPILKEQFGSQPVIVSEEEEDDDASEGDDDSEDGTGLAGQGQECAATKNDDQLKVSVAATSGYEHSEDSGDAKPVPVPTIADELVLEDGERVLEIIDTWEGVSNIFGMDRPKDYYQRKKFYDKLRQNPFEYSFSEKALCDFLGTDSEGLSKILNLTKLGRKVDVDR